MLSSLREGSGIIFPVNGCTRLEKHLSPGLWNMFVLCERERSFVCVRTGNQIPAVLLLLPFGLLRRLLGWELSRKLALRRFVSILRPVLLRHAPFLVGSYHPVETLLGRTAHSSHLSVWGQLTGGMCVFRPYSLIICMTNISPSQYYVRLTGCYFWEFAGCCWLLLWELQMRLGCLSFFLCAPYCPVLQAVLQPQMEASSACVGWAWGRGRWKKIVRPILII